MTFYAQKLWQSYDWLHLPFLNGDRVLYWSLGCPKEQVFPFASSVSFFLYHRQTRLQRHDVGGFAATFAEIDTSQQAYRRLAYVLNDERCVVDVVHRYCQCKV
jgi:hypothetical protein